MIIQLCSTGTSKAKCARRATVWSYKTRRFHCVDDVPDGEVVVLLQDGHLFKPPVMPAQAMADIYGEAAWIRAEKSGGQS